MTDKETIKLALKAGLKGYQEQAPGIDGAYGNWAEFEAFAALTRADERRKFAKWLDEKGAPHYAEQIRARSQTPCTHEWIDATTTKPQWHCAKCGVEYKKEKA